MAKVVLGIHGLSNKPEPSVLRRWWLDAINDGLKKADGNTVPDQRFDLAYWADLMYESHDREPEPYTPPDTDEADDDRSEIVAIGREVFSTIIGKFGDLKERMSDSERIEGIKNAVREKVVKDLAQYYDDDSTVQFTARAGTQTRSAIRSVLREMIERHEADDILLIGHSMGSIVAYDVLRSLERSTIKVSHFVTIGSPLGLPVVKERTREEWDDKGGPFVPASVGKSWVNYADPKDLVSADLTLRGEYHPATGVDVRDVAVSNGYCYVKSGRKKHNHHKSYGYLRTPDLSQHLKAFLND
jgi:hypothetical protein